MNRYAAIIFLVFCTFASEAAKKHDIEVHEKLLTKRQKIKQTYEIEQNRLQRETDLRWTRRQKQVEKKEQNKIIIEKLQNEVEGLYTDVARMREEVLLRENSVLVENERFESEKDKSDWFTKAVDAILRKESENIKNYFPIGQQSRSLEIQKIALQKGRNNNSVNQIQALQEYALANFESAKTLSLSKETIISNKDNVEEAIALRVGNIFAIGLSDSQRVFYLGNIGRIESEPYTWMALTDETVVSSIVNKMPDWLVNGKVNSSISVDVMQNKYSSELLGAGKIGVLHAILDFIKVGGIILVPLVFISLWALYIVINRLIIYSLAHSRGDKFIDKAVKFLSQKEKNDAVKFAQTANGVLARILGTCLKHSQWNRSVAEKAVKEQLLTEIPVLDKHLNTLAVLAGAAPLLGLLGTVTGMIEVFESITRFGTGDPKLLAGGISEALITTEVGLIIAIPTMLMHNFLSNRRNHIQSDMEMYAMRILNRLWPEK